MWPDQQETANLVKFTEEILNEIVHFLCSVWKMGRGLRSKILNLLNPFVPNASFLYPPENIRKPYGFLMFSGGRERVNWERMG